MQKFCSAKILHYTCSIEVIVNIVAGCYFVCTYMYMLHQHNSTNTGVLNCMQNWNAHANNWNRVWINIIIINLHSCILTRHYEFKFPADIYIAVNTITHLHVGLQLWSSQSCVKCTLLFLLSTTCIIMFFLRLLAIVI